MSKYVKTVKAMRRGKNMSKKLHSYFVWLFLLFMLLVLGGAWCYWKYELGGQGGFIEALWAVVFTLVGQGGLVTEPTTAVGKIVIFLVSIIGISLMGVVLTEVLARMMKYNMRSLLGMNTCKYEGHTVLCGWNGRSELVLQEVIASGQKASVVASQKPASLTQNAAFRDVFFIAGDPSDQRLLRQAGIEHAESAVIFASPLPGQSQDDVDSRSILTALAVETLQPAVYSVIELLNPANERHARRANVDDIVFCDTFLGNVLAMSSVQRGISAFIADLLSCSDGGSSFCVRDIDESWDGKTVGAFFDELRKEGWLPVALLRPAKSKNTEEWSHEINPAPETIITLPMRVIFITPDEHR